MSALRPVRDTRVVFDVEIIDGPQTEDRVRTMPLTVYSDRPALANAGEPPIWVFLNGAAGKGLWEAVLHSLLHNL